MSEIKQAFEFSDIVCEEMKKFKEILNQRLKAEIKTSDYSNPHGRWTSQNRKKGKCKIEITFNTDIYK